MIIGQKRISHQFKDFKDLKGERFKSLRWPILVRPLPGPNAPPAGKKIYPRLPAPGQSTLSLRQ